MHLVIAAAVGGAIGALVFGPIGAGLGAAGGVFVAEKMGK